MKNELIRWFGMEVYTLVFVDGFADLAMTLFFLFPAAMVGQVIENEKKSAIATIAILLFPTVLIYGTEIIYGIL